MRNLNRHITIKLIKLTQNGVVLQHVLTKVELRIITLVTGINRAVISYFIIVLFGFPFMLLQVDIQTALCCKFCIAVCKKKIFI